MALRCGIRQESVWEPWFPLASGFAIFPAQIAGRSGPERRRYIAADSEMPRRISKVVRLASAETVANRTRKLHHQVTPELVREVRHIAQIELRPDEHVPPDVTFRADRAMQVKVILVWTCR